MGILKIIGVVLILLWLVLWLAVKVTVGAVHLLVALGAVLIVVSLFGGAKR